VTAQVVLGLLLLQAPQAGPDTVRVSAAQAVDLALEANPSLNAARAEARAAGSGSRMSSTAFLPTVRLDLQGMRSTDPVAVFGLRLRQARFGQSDFAIDALNNPDPYGGWTAAAVVEQPILAPEGLYGHSAAGKAGDASEAAAQRAAGATVFLVSRAYWGAKVAQARVEALGTALVALQAHAEQAAQFHRQGLVTGLDARLAGLRASEVEVRRLQASAEAENALSQLRAMLALSSETTLVLADSLEAVAESDCADCDDSSRGDLRALELGAQAAELDVKRAWASQLPSVFAFGSLAHHSDASPWGRGSGDWTVGIGVRWNLFRGLAGPGDVSRAKALRDAARSRADAAARQAQVEVSSAVRLWQTAAAQLAVASQARAEAQATLDQAQLRYRTGVSPITELLDVQSAATNADLNLLAARHDLLVAAAAVEFAYGVNDS